ncbi:MAG TPA: glycosyltransferase, partial [Burkholderiales bacterium]|nr:glycosyltransferase [Burkholderiales bacterium]
MKVLHVIPSLSATQGGPSVALPLMERVLTEAGVAVTVATTDDDGPRAHMSVRPGQPVIVNGATRFYFRKQTEFYKCSVPLWRWLVRRVREFDVVHVHALFSFASVAAARCALRSRIPYVVRPLGVLNRWGMENRRPWLKRISLRWIEGPLLRHAAAVHYTSRREQEEAEQAGVCAAGAVIPLGIDTRAFRQLPGPDRFQRRFPQAVGRTLILFLSRLDKKKGLDLLLPAFAKLRRKHPRPLLVLGGDGQDGFVRRLMNSARELGIQPDVVWAGHLEGEDKLSALSAASVFVLPSYSENFGIAAVEAFAAGLPSVLTSEVAVASEAQLAKAARVVPCEVASLTAALGEMLSDPELRAQMSANAVRLAAQRFSFEAMGKNLVNLYESI